MKKIIIIALAVLLAGTAYAAKFEVSGSAYMRGELRSGYNLDNEADTYSLYDFDFNIFPKFVIDENNFATLKLAMRDMTVGVDQETGTDKEHSDDNIAVERAYFQTKIGPTALSLGLMDGYAWASDFGNSTQAAWRVKAVTTTPVGAVIAIHQKNTEASTKAGVNGSDDDVYYLAMVTKAGPMFIKPLLVYANMNSKDLVKTAFQLGVDGKFGDMSLEAEFQYQSVEGDNSDTNDYALMAFYLHASMKMGDNVAGAMLLYGGTDETDSGYSFGSAFGDDAAFLTILDDDLNVGNTSDLDKPGSIAGAAGLTVIALYYSAKVMDNLTVTPKFGYVMSNYDETDVKSPLVGGGHPTGGVETAMELDIDCSYKINDAVTYSFGLAYAMLSAYSGTDPDDIYVLQHKVSISF